MMKGVLRSLKAKVVFNSIFRAIAVAYIPIVFIIPLMINDTGIVSIGYPLKLLVSFLYTLPFFTVIMRLGSSASEIIFYVSGYKRLSATEWVGAVAALVTLVACFAIDSLLYLALFGVLVNVAAWGIGAALKKKRGGAKKEINGRIFAIAFAVIMAVAVIITLVSVITNAGAGRPQRDEYAMSDYGFTV